MTLRVTTRDEKVSSRPAIAVIDAIVLLADDRSRILRAQKERESEKTSEGRKLAFQVRHATALLRCAAYRAPGRAWSPRCL